MPAIQAAQEYGTTIPVVPRIDSPPTIPSRAFSVRSAIRSPSGIAISTTASGVAISASAARIMARGPGLIAGSPGGSGRPGRVIVPTPGPARNARPLAGRRAETVARISAPWVTSGSSPASLTMAALAHPGPERGLGQREGGAPAAGQRDLHRIGELGPEQGGKGGLGGGGGAGAGGPAAAQLGWVLHFVAIVPPARHIDCEFRRPKAGPRSGRDQACSGAGTGANQAPHRPENRAGSGPNSPENRVICFAVLCGVAPPRLAAELRHRTARACFASVNPFPHRRRWVLALVLTFPASIVNETDDEPAGAESGLLSAKQKTWLKLKGRRGLQPLIKGQGSSAMKVPNALRAVLRDLPPLEPGSVWLAGAGPGDPGLLTLRRAGGARAGRCGGA